MSKVRLIMKTVLLFGCGIAVQAEQINNGDFGAGTAGWQTKSTPGSSVTISGGVASFDDSGDSASTEHAQALYQNFSEITGDQISYSFDLRFDETLANTWRFSLYGSNDGYGNSSDVFRSFVNYHSNSGEWRFNVVSSGPNKVVNLTPTIASIGDWVQVSGTIDLLSGTTSGTISNISTAAAIDSWSDLALYDDEATGIRGFAVYDPNGKTASSAISVDNVSVIPEPTTVGLVSALGLGLLFIRRVFAV